MLSHCCLKITSAFSSETLFGSGRGVKHFRFLRPIPRRKRGGDVGANKNNTFHCVCFGLKSSAGHCLLLSGSSKVTAGPFLQLNTTAEGPWPQIKALARGGVGGELLKPGSLCNVEWLENLTRNIKSLCTLGVSLSEKEAHWAGHIYSNWP